MFNTSALLAVPLAATVAAAFTLTAPDLRAQAGSRERTLFASVVDRDGKPVEGLGPDDFIVREDGVRREVLRVTPATEPIAIAVLVDNSQAASDDIQNIRKGLTTFVQQVHDVADVAIIGLADRPTIYQDYTRNVELLDKAVGRLFAQPGSGMQMLEAMVEVSRGLNRREEPRAVVLPIITDGPEFSNLHYDHVLDALKTSGAALYAVTIGTFPVSMKDTERNRATVLDQGPRRSGGTRITLLSSMAVPETLTKVAGELKNQYKVVYGRPESLIQPGTVTVEVARPGLTGRGTPERRTPGA
jgi:Ca-activated chloride channel family protein